MRSIIRFLLLAALVVCAAYELHAVGNKDWLHSVYFGYGLLFVLLLLWLLRNYEASKTPEGEAELARDRQQVEQELLESGFGHKHF